MFKRKNEKKEMMHSSETMDMGPNLSFAAAEAYKLLRANIQFSLPHEKKCTVIGVTSSLKSEGKSTTAINLAYTLAETGNRVLLLDSDMRLPSIAHKLGLFQAPGLSNFLSGQDIFTQMIQHSNLSHNLYVIAAGDIPPNPSELMETEYMRKLISSLSNNFNYIILDLPPIGEVADALTVSKYIDGMLVIVRQDYCTHRALQDTIRQLEFAEIRLLGFVVTRTNTHKNKYYYYKGYKK